MIDLIFPPTSMLVLAQILPSTRACRESESMIRDLNLVAIFWSDRERKLIRIFFWNDSIQKIDSRIFY